VKLSDRDLASLGTLLFKPHHLEEGED
jgi:hypothetical protein